MDSLSLFRRIHLILFKPKEYFSQIKEEVSYTPIIQFLIFVVLIPYIAITVISSIVNPNEEVPLFTNIFLQVFFSTILLILMILLTHFFVNLFGGKQGLVNTIKAFVYSAIVIPLISLAFLFSQLKLLGNFSFVFSLIYMGLNLYSLQLFLWGCEKLHKLPMWKTFFAVIIGGIFALIVYFVFVIGVSLIIK